MIHYVIGDATLPIKRPAVIAHICNDVGAWGAGFVLALSRRWKQPEEMYWRTILKLGNSHIVQVADGISVCNMIAQRGVARSGRLVDYDSLLVCLENLAGQLRDGETVHMPRIGCGIGGGLWSEVEPLIKQATEGVDVYVYDL